MRLTRFSDFGLRVLLYAEANQNKLFTIAELTSVFSVSKAHLMKVVNMLAREGYLESIRGRNGGLRLNRKAADIKLGELIMAMEPDNGFVECMGSDNKCILCDACTLPNLFNGALGAFVNYLDKYTLADVALSPNSFLK